jgi:tRNA-dihydrouridine synthase B
MIDKEDIISTIKDAAILAPMLDVSDIPFRKLCRDFGAVYTMTEMVSAKGILNDAHDSYRYAAFSQEEQPIVLQLVIADPHDAEPALKKLLPFKPSQININSGCPEGKICEAGAGAHLLDDLPRLAKITETVVRVSGLPVSVKVRGRGRSRTSTVREIVRVVQESGAAYIIVHGRTRDTSYNHPASWDFIAEAKAAADIPVIGNGDVFSSAAAKEMAAQTNCDSVMVGRGALGSPWIFRDIAEGRSCSVWESAPPPGELLQLIIRHMRGIISEYGELRAISKMRKHMLWYVRRFRNWETLRHDIFQKDKAEDLIESLQRFFSVPQEVFAEDSPEWEKTEKSFQNRVLFWMAHE